MPYLTVGAVASSTTNKSVVASTSELISRTPSFNPMTPTQLSAFSRSSAVNVSAVAVSASFQIEIVSPSIIIPVAVIV